MAILSRRSFTFAAPVLARLQISSEVRVDVDATAVMGPFRHVWSFFGYDEPNYTYMKNGRKLLKELAALSPADVYIRTHNLLNSGDGAPALKWGSTNVYTEDESGKPVYDWRILDRIFDTFRDTRTKPLVEIGFMPEALSIAPKPYRHSWPKGNLFTGWAYPPKDYGKWAELIFRWVERSVSRYGKNEVESWYWELWNEPNIGYWRGTAEEHHKLYDYTAEAVKRALPSARFGGPHSTGPSSPKAGEFLRTFLEHCLRGRNYASGKMGAPLDFIAFHAKGAPKVEEGRVRMGMAKQVQDIAKGFEIVASFPELRGKPVILGESDPEGCAACSARVYPQNAYRNGTLYPCYVAAMLRHTLDLANRYGVNLEGTVTWAFEFENQPWFDGFRSLATNGVDKPVLNVFRMLGLMGGERVAVHSDGAVATERVVAGGVREEPDVNALATRSDREIAVLVWNYHDDESPAPGAAVRLRIRGAFPPRVLMRHYRIDEEHSNAYAAWRQMGAPQSPTPEERRRLEAAGQLQMLSSPAYLFAESGELHTEFSLPRHAVSLLKFSW